MLLVQAGGFGGLSPALFFIIYEAVDPPIDPADRFDVIPFSLTSDKNRLAQ